jgi:hypothetical protein
MEYGGASGMVAEVRGDQRDARSATFSAVSRSPFISQSQAQRDPTAASLALKINRYYLLDVIR